MYKSLQTRLEGKLGVRAAAPLPLAAKKVENTGLWNAEGSRWARGAPKQCDPESVSKSAGQVSQRGSRVST